jgi:hypothetical protein
MSLSTLFTIIAVLVLLRIFWLRLKAAGTNNEAFRRLLPKDQLAVLKECLLNNPTEGNLQNLKAFCAKQGADLEVESYRPYIKKQLEITKRKDALAEDSALFGEEAAWLDRIRPLEFAEAETAKRENRTGDYLSRTLEGIARLYSDEAILEALRELEPEYPKAASLAENYRSLMELRDSSGADDQSLDTLRKAKSAWEENLLQVDFEP